jgi:hypothetical protein
MWQVYASIAHLKKFSAAEIVTPVPHVKIGVANSGRAHLEQDLGACWLRSGGILASKWLAELGYSVASHLYLARNGRS